MRVWSYVALGLGLSWLGAGLAAAAPKRSAAPIEGVVVKVADGEVIVDLGQAQGVPPNGRIELFRRVVVAHPVTKKQIEDRFPIGSVVPAQVGSLLTIIRDVSGLQRAPVPGDFAVYQPPVTLAPVVAEAPRAPARPVAAPTAEVSARAPAAPAKAIAADAAALEATFQASLGRSLPERVALYEAWLAAFPKSGLRDGVGAEVATLRSVMTQIRDGQARTAEVKRTSDALTVRHQSTPAVTMGERVEVAIALIETERVEQVRLLTARGPDEKWSVQPMTRDGDYYFRADVPAAQLAQVGTVFYMVEAVRLDGRLTSVVGTTKKPHRIQVEPLPPGASPPGHSHLEVMARMVDFNTVGDAADRYFQFESAFTYELAWESLRAVQVGVGIIDGEGGPTEMIDAGGSTRTVALNYAFAEIEAGLGEWVGVAARLVGGNHQSASDVPQRAMVGTELRLRLGRFDETRFVAGVSMLDVLGTQGFLDAHVEVFERLPMRLGVVVTNLPVDADLGVQIEYQIGWQAVDWLTLIAQVGWNARTINHYGFTGGGGLALDW